MDLLKIKRTYDKKDVFTPNLFCVGASRKFKTAPANSPALDSGDKRPTVPTKQKSHRKAKLASNSKFSKLLFWETSEGLKQGIFICVMRRACIE
jgi:hypothetical protein